VRFPPLLIVTIATLALALAGCGGGHGAGASSTGGEFDGAALPPGLRAPDFTLTDQQGHRISLSGQRGKVVALTFLASDCRACTLVAQQIRGALDELGSPSDVSTIFVSTSPRTDTSASAARFLADTSLTGRASFLIGSRRRLQPVWRAYHASGAEDAIAVLLIDRAGLERVELGLEQLTPESLAHDIRALLAGR